MPSYMFHLVIVLAASAVSPVLSVEPPAYGSLHLG